MKGIYIVLEGIVGTGKTTQSKKIVEFLKEKYPNREIILTREPGGDEISEAVRKVVQGTEFSIEMTPECEAYLYAASRAQTLRSIVKPVLDRGGIVVADRSFISSAAIQGKARGLGLSKILEINKIAVDGIFPDIILFIELAPSFGLKRTFDKEGDKFEKESLDFYEEMRKGYKEISEMPGFKEKWHNIDGSGNAHQVFERIKGFLQEVLN